MLVLTIRLPLKCGTMRPYERRYADLVIANAISPKPTVGVLIRYAQSAETLPGVLASLDRQTRKPDQILGVDSAGCAACGELIRQSGGVVLRWMHEYEHSRVLNFGLQHLHTDYVLVLSSHTVLDDPCVLERMTAAMEDPTVAVSAGNGMKTLFTVTALIWARFGKRGSNLAPSIATAWG